MTGRGSVTVLVAAVAAVAVVAGSLLVALHVLVATRVAVQTAADAAALAAVDGGPEAAARAAAANGASVVRCSCVRGRPSTVVVRAVATVGPFGAVEITAGARAERVARPVPPDRSPPGNG